jgi:hypothetical protein
MIENIITFFLWVLYLGLSYILAYFLWKFLRKELKETLIFILSIRHLIIINIIGITIVYFILQTFSNFILNGNTFIPKLSFIIVPILTYIYIVKK